MEASVYKMLAPIYQITRHRFPEDRILHIYHMLLNDMLML